MLEVANLFTKNKKRVSPHFKNLSLSVLARFCIDDSNEVMSSASNLIINSLVYKDDDILKVTKMASELFSVHIQREKDQEVKFSTTEITWLMMITYSNIFAPPPTPADVIKLSINRKRRRIELIFIIICISLDVPLHSSNSEWC